MIQLHDYLLVKNFLLHLKKKKKKSSKKKQDEERKKDSITSNIINKLTNIRLLSRII